jgi:hypothetical protein
VRLGVLFVIAGVVVSTLPGGSAAGRPGGELLPDLEQRVPFALGVSSDGARFRLGFASAVSNVGAGPLVVTASRPSRKVKTMPARQLVQAEDGQQRVGRIVGRLRYEHAETHSHWHLLPFDDYALRGAGDGATASLSVKQGFCLGDRYRDARAIDVDSPPAPAFRHECGKGNPRLLRMREGISVGYGDLYRPNLEGQSFDVTDLPAGDYVLSHEVNRGRRIRESDYANNAAAVLVRLDWPNGASAEPSVQVVAECPATTRCTR